MFAERDGGRVRLSLARWRHIRRKHPEVTEDQIRAALARPDRVEVRPDGRRYWRAEGRGMVCVAVNDSRELYVRTAFFTPS
jgi:hypothetical protein